MFLHCSGAALHPLSTISSIMKNSPGGKRLIADWIKVLESEASHDANYYYKKQE